MKFVVEPQNIQKEHRPCKMAAMASSHLIYHVIFTRKSIWLAHMWRS